VERAARDVPQALGHLTDWEPEDFPTGLPAGLVKIVLRRLGHERPAAAHALYWLVGMGVLEAALPQGPDCLRRALIRPGPRWHEWSQGRLGLVLAAALLTGAEQQEAAPADTGPAIIFSLGDCRYRVDSGPVQPVLDHEDTVLQTFLESNHGHLSGEELEERSGLRDHPGRAARILRDLCRRYGGQFAPAIRLPGKKGPDGYRVRIQVADIDE